MAKDETGNLRHEIKFSSELEDYEIESIIKNHPAMFFETFYQRQVNNIYLDSVCLENYDNHVSGVCRRFKIRIRWYGKLIGFIKKPELEIKIKNDKEGKKLSFPLKPFVLDKNFSSKYLEKDIFAKSKLPKWLIEQLKFCFPVLANSFKRKYFLSADKKYRLTLDTDLEFFKIENKNNLFLEKIKQDNFNILELKYSPSDYKSANCITEHLPFRLTAFSKYVSGINVLEV